MPFPNGVENEESCLMNGGDPIPDSDLERARELALRYRCEFVDLTDFQLHHELFKKFSPELMFRYNFVPLEETADGKLAIAVADPSQLMMIDEISLLLQKRIVTRVATLAQISKVLNRGDEGPSQIADGSPEGPLGPSSPNAPVAAPLKPRPHLRSGAAKAVPEQEQ
jgi:Type II secretion system (T2SS), protein E, N-terminal domain